MKEQGCLNLRQKISDFGILKIEFEKNIGIFEISTLEFVYLKNLVGKKQCLNLGKKNALFGHFWPKMFYLGIFGREF